jgi:hypothetical protein
LIKGDKKFTQVLCNENFESIKRIVNLFEQNKNSKYSTVNEAIKQEMKNKKTSRINRAVWTRSIFFFIDY